MPESDMEKLLPRLRRFARCLFCEPGEADTAVCESLEAEIDSANGPAIGHDFVATELRLFHNVLQVGRCRLANGNDRDKPGVFSSRAVESGPPPRNIEAAVATLDFQERAVIALHILEGFGLDEIASLMGVSRPQVNEALASARRQLMRLVAAMKASGNRRDVAFGVCGQ